MAQTTDAVLIADRAGRVAYVNPSFEVLTGVPLEDARAMAPHAMLQSLHEPGVYDVIRATLLLGLPYRDTVVHRPRDGRIYHADETVTPATGSPASSRTIPSRRPVAGSSRRTSSTSAPSLISTISGSGSGG